MDKEFYSISSRIQLVNAKNEDNQTPLHFMARSGAYETAEILLTQGADVNAESENGLTPVELAMLVNTWKVKEHAGRSKHSFQ